MQGDAVARVRLGLYSKRTWDSTAGSPLGVDAEEHCARSLRLSCPITDVPPAI